MNLILNSSIIWGMIDILDETASNTVCYRPTVPELMFGIYQNGGTFSAVILLIAMIGILLMSMKSVKFFRDWRGSKFFFGLSFEFLAHQKSKIKPEELKSSIAKDIFNVLILTGNKTKSPAAIRTDISNIVDANLRSLDSFRSAMTLLIILSLCVGLSGTLWGFHLVLYSGTMEPQEVLAGIGISLSALMTAIFFIAILYCGKSIIAGLYSNLIYKIYRKAKELHPELSGSSVDIPE
ncbi:hypothetical protein JXJ21_24230 [candidate division KSB1 bacterium]|nr:hypothetical protein [candidate division KSB1 bacterium]